MSFEARDADIGPGAFWRTLGARPIGATVITAMGEGGPEGFLGLSFAHVSAKPPTVLVSVGSTTSALGAIRARTIVIQSELDAYFPPVDSAFECERIPDAELRVIPSVWGHMAPFNPQDQAFIDESLRELLAG